jgi:hypothetical protein
MFSRNASKCSQNVARSNRRSLTTEAGHFLPTHLARKRLSKNGGQGRIAAGVPGFRRRSRRLIDGGGSDKPGAGAHSFRRGSRMFGPRGQPEQSEEAEPPRRSQTAATGGLVAVLYDCRVRQGE